MQRVIVSLLLLITVFLMSGLFTPEMNQPAKQPSPAFQSDAPPYQTVAHNFLQTDGVYGALGYPSLVLILLAALASSLAMAIFIYGSRFIATLVAG